MNNRTAPPLLAKSLVSGDKFRRHYVGPRGGTGQIWIADRPLGPSAASLAVPPRMKITLHRGRRGFCGVVEPAAAAPLQVITQRVNARGARGVDRGEIKSHRLQERALEIFLRTVAELDLAGVRSEATNDPFAPYVERRIGRPIFAFRKLQRARRLAAMHPGPCRRHQRLGLAQHASAAPVGDRDIARPAEAAATRDAPAIADFCGAFRQACVEKLHDNARRLAGGLAVDQRVSLLILELLPEFSGFDLTADGLG